MTVLPAFTPTTGIDVSGVDGMGRLETSVVFLPVAGDVGTAIVGGEKKLPVVPGEGLKRLLEPNLVGSPV